MSSNLTCLKVFIASPGGLAEERKAFRDAIQEYNETEAIPRGFFFQAVGWEDTLAGVGRPQTIINEDIRRADYFVLLLWNRWGSPPDTSSLRFSSGTEEEYHVALECYEKHQIRQMVMMFKAVEPTQMSDPGPQLERVLKFRNEIEQQKTHLFHTFDTVESFCKLIRKHLAQWVRSEENGGASQEPGSPGVGPEPTLGDLPPESTREQTPRPFDVAVTKAWALANEGRVTEAEVEFAKTAIGRQRPEPLLEYGLYLSRLGRFDQSRRLFEEAINIATDQADHSSIASGYRNLGIVLRIQGDLHGAEQMLRKALEINEKHGRLDGVAANYGNLGNVLLTRGDLDGAEQMFSKALEINEKLGRLEGVAINYGNLANVIQTRGDLDGAKQTYSKALEMNKKLGRLEGMASNYGNLGIVLQTRGDLDGAEQMFRKALEINEKLGRLHGVAINYGNLANVLQTRGDMDGAEQMFRKALEINEKLGHLEGLAANYSNLGNVLRKRDLDSAEQMYRKSLEINEKVESLDGVATNYSNLGNVLLTRHDLDGAEQMYRKALEINEKLGHLEGMANNYGNLGKVLQTRGDLDGAKQTYSKGLVIARRLGSPSLIAQITSSLSSLQK